MFYAKLTKYQVHMFPTFRYKLWHYPAMKKKRSYSKHRLVYMKSKGQLSAACAGSGKGLTTLGLSVYEI
jgi:hypothetical protein